MLCIPTAPAHLFIGAPFLRPVTRVPNDIFVRQLRVDGLDGIARLVPHPHITPHLFTPSNTTCTAELGVV